MSFINAITCLVWLGLMNVILIVNDEGGVRGFLESGTCVRP